MWSAILHSYICIELCFNFWFVYSRYRFLTMCGFDGEYLLRCCFAFDGYIVIVFSYIASLIFHFISLIQYCIEKEKTLYRFYIVLFVYLFYSKLILCFLRILLDCWTRLSARLYSSIYSSGFIFAFFSFTQSLRFIFNLYVSSGVIFSII